MVTREDAERAPTEVDHLILGCHDLDRGIDYVEELLGCRAASGGAHPGRGTRNAVLHLGDRAYLEIIAPDPEQDQLRWFPQLPFLPQPVLLAWAVARKDLLHFAKLLSERGVASNGPTPGSRQRPNGGILNWKTLTLEDDQGGLLPFFIEWGSDSLHPSTDAPTGCKIVRLALSTPKPTELKRLSTVLALNVLIEEGGKAQLRARFSGLGGNIVELTS
jgi:hypothetical protein